MYLGHVSREIIAVVVTNLIKKEQQCQMEQIAVWGEGGWIYLLLMPCSQSGTNLIFLRHCRHVMCVMDDITSDNCLPQV